MWQPQGQLPFTLSSLQHLTPSTAVKQPLEVRRCQDGPCALGERRRYRCEVVFTFIQACPYSESQRNTHSYGGARALVHTDAQGPAQITPPFYCRIFYYKIISV